MSCLELHNVIHRLLGDDDDGHGQGLLDKELHALGQVVHCTVTSQHTQVLDLFVLGLLGEELHGLGQVLDMLVPGLLDENCTHLLACVAKLSTCLCRDYMMESCTPLARLFTIR